MSTEEKIDIILTKLEEKKQRDFWDKVQIVATILTGVLTLLLASANLWITNSISDQSRKQADVFHQDQVMEQQRESDRKERDELIQELSLLPNLTNMLEGPNPSVRNIAKGVLQNLNNRSMFKGHPISNLAILYEEEKASSRGAILYIAKQNENNKPFWVYVGQKENNIWQTKFFDTEDLPLPNAQIKTIANVYQHDSKPKKIGEPDRWDFGKKIGTLKNGSIVEVVDTLTLEGNNFWALVK